MGQQSGDTFFIDPFKTINDTEDFIRLFERNEKNAQSYMLGIEHQENGLIGKIGYDYIDEDEKTANLFFVLDKEFWHKGIMTIMMRMIFLSTILNNKHQLHNNILSVKYSDENHNAMILKSKFVLKNN